MVDILQKLNIFSKIKFKEDTHEYFYLNDENKEVPFSKSVTRFLSAYEVPFDQDFWAKHSAQKENVPVDVILDRWARKARISQVLGTALHARLEFLFNNKIYSIDHEYVQKKCKHNKEEINEVLELYNELGKIIDDFYYKARANIIPVKLEMVIGDIDLDLAGCVDGLFWNVKDQELQIFDWKSNAEFKTTNKYHNKLLKPFEQLDQCSLNIYSLQLSIYKYIIEKNTGLKIGKCWLVHFDRIKNDYKFYKCLDLTPEIKTIFE